MKLKSLLVRSAGSAVLALIATHTWAGPASLVKLTGQVGFSCGTGNGGFEQVCAGGEHVETGGFSLTYDPSILDTAPEANKGLFQGVIKSFSMTVSQVDRPDLSFSLVGPGDFYRDNDGMGTDWMTWKMTLAETNGVIQPSAFSFGMYLLGLEDPNKIPSFDFWSAVIGLGAGGAGVHETDWLYGGSLNAEIIPSPVPAPGSLWLTLIGAGGVLAQRLRRRN